MPKNKTVLTAEPMHKFVLTAEATQQFKEIIDDYARQTTWKRYFSELPKKVTDGHYGRIVKPMDLAQVRSKLQRGLYEDPVDILDDVWQTFTNAMLYFKGSVKKTRESRTIFMADVAPLFKDLGYCCADNRDLPESALSPVCYKCNKRVAWGSLYHAAWDYARNNDFDPVLCNACFKVTTTAVHMAQAEREAVVVPVSAFEKFRFSELKQEMRTPCKGCGRRLHATCLGYTPYHVGAFRCQLCDPQLDASKTLAENLPTCALSEYVEAKVNQFMAEALAAGDEPPPKVLVRVLVSTPQKTGFAPLMSKRYELESMDCVLRSVFVFEKLANGEEVCFFAFRVLEFADSCSYEPNRRCVYLQYVDSVKLFDPDVLRTKVYQRILAAYFDFARHNGFERVYLWSCPPKKNGPSYIFPSRPADQKMPTEPRLYNWYIRFLQLCVTLGVVSKFAQLREQIKKDGVTSLSQVAYFECDHTADIREEILEAVKLPISRPWTRFGTLPEKPKSFAQKSLSPEDKQFLEKAYMDQFDMRLKEKHPDTFLVVELNTAATKFVANNSIVSCPLIEERTELKYQLEAVEDKLGFETVRRAGQATKYSVGMINEDLTVEQSECSYCKQPANGDEKVCLDCAKSTDAEKARSVAHFLKSLHVDFAMEILEHAVVCHVEKCSYRLCAGFKLLLELHASKPDTKHLDLFLEAVNLHKVKCTKTPGECKVPGCEGKPKTPRVTRRTAKPAPLANITNDPSTAGVGRALRKRTHDSSAPATRVKIARRH